MGALIAAAERRGVEIHSGAEVVAADREAGTWTVRTADGESFQAGALVAAAGCWSGQADWLPVADRPAVRPVKGEILTLRGSAAEPVCERIIVGERVYMVPRGDGRLVVGATVEERGFDTTLTAGGVHELDRSFLDPAAQVTGRVFPLEGLKLLAPVVPSKIIGIALNYPDNPSLPGNAGPGPGYFAKLPSAVIGDQGEIVPPADSTNLNYEGEMVVVIGKQARRVSVKEALDHVFGVTAGNDVTERGYPFSPLQILKAKGSDTFAPLGPWVVPGLLYDDLRLTTRLNGQVVQSVRTSLDDQEGGGDRRGTVAAVHARAGGSDLHRHAGKDAGTESGRRDRGRDRRGRRAAQPGRQAAVTADLQKGETVDGVPRWSKKKGPSNMPEPFRIFSITEKLATALGR